jgi:hypothetical protein
VPSDFIRITKTSNLRYAFKLNFSLMEGALMNRRSFLKLCGLAAQGLAFGFGTSGCTTFPKDVNWASVPDKDFSLAGFDQWFETHKLYNGVNPNLRMYHVGYCPSFSRSISAIVSPGIDYNSNHMYAAADGVVSQVGKIDTSRTGRIGGGVIKVAHDIRTHGVIFTSIYAHTGTPYVKPGDFIKRGDLIADVMYTPNAKLMILKSQNYIDPDNYGHNHSYMKYWDGTEISNENVDQKNLVQLQIVGDLIKACSQELELWPRYHTNQESYKGRAEGCVWDQTEMFRYLSELYNARPRLFPNLPPEKFAEYKFEFYANQPIVFSLPLKA